MSSYNKITPRQQFFIIIFCLVAALSTSLNLRLLGQLRSTTNLSSDNIDTAVEKFEQKTISSFNPTNLVKLIKPVSQKDLQCLAENVYYEARGESLLGKIAVAQVTINRAKHPRWPNSICNVVYQEYTKTIEGEYYDDANTEPRQIRTCQFSWVCDPQRSPIAKNSQQWRESLQVANSLLAVDSKMIKDITNGATFFHAKELGRVWPQYKKVAVIDNHVFYRR